MGLFVCLFCVVVVVYLFLTSQFLSNTTCSIVYHLHKNVTEVTERALSYTIYTRMSLKTLLNACSSFFVGGVGVDVLCCCLFVCLLFSSSSSFLFSCC